MSICKNCNPSPTAPPDGPDEETCPYCGRLLEEHDYVVVVDEMGPGVDLLCPSPTAPPETGEITGERNAGT